MRPVRTSEPVRGLCVLERIRQWLGSLAPVQLLALFFVIAIVIGTGLLLLPFSTTSPITFIDAAFTAVSAVCVTGLIVVETGTQFTGFGQGVILTLIQFGGLGIMATSTFVLLTLGNRASLRNLIMLRDEYTVSGGGSAKRVFLIVATFTIVAQVVGAIVLTRRFGSGPVQGHNALWAGIFHSVSAFCNAGFSLFNDSFVGYRNDLTINMMVPFLIIFGGLGFPALIDLYRKVRARIHGTHVALSLHAKIVFTSTLVLLVVGTVGFFAIEGAMLQGASFGEQVQASWFQSVTTRTAGFNTLELSKASEPTLLLSMVMMIIGGSPGSTAGGIKTTTLVVIFLVVIARLRGHERVEIGKRSIPAAVITKALVVAVLGAALIVIATLLLLITDGGSGRQLVEGHGNFVGLLFEVVSAFGTVGLSVLKSTGDLTGGGKVIIMCVMYLGRLGPLLLAQMVFAADKPQHYKYPEEYLLVG